MKSQLRLLLVPPVLLLAGLYLPALSAARVDAAQPPVLQAESFRHHVDRFNNDDEELYRNAFPDAEAWEFLEANIPLFQCPANSILKPAGRKVEKTVSALRDTHASTVSTRCPASSVNSSARST